MDIYIAELAGKDSVAAIHKFMRTHHDSKIIPSIAYTRTEYGGFDSYFKSLEYLKKFAVKCNVTVEELHNLSDERLWNIFCVKYQYQLHQKFGFYTPCIMCHMYTHLLRMPLCYQYGAAGIITGERTVHGDKVKINQHPRTLECFKKLIDYSGLKLIQPVVTMKDTGEVDREIGNQEIVTHANDTKCILSGNLNGYIIDEMMLQKFLDEYIYKIGIYIIDAFRAGRDIPYQELGQLIEGAF